MKESARAAVLRAELLSLAAAFDEALAAEPGAPDSTFQVDLVLCGLGDQRLAIRASALRGVHALPTLVPLVGGRPTLLGLCGIGGAVVAVHDLGRLFGREGEARHVLVLQEDPELGLGVSTVHGLHRARVDQIQPLAPSPASPLGPGRELFTAGLVAGPHAGCPILDVAATRAALER